MALLKAGTRTLRGLSLSLFSALSPGVYLLWKPPGFRIQLPCGVPQLQDQLDPGADLETWHRYFSSGIQPCGRKYPTTQRSVCCFCLAEKLFTTSLSRWLNGLIVYMTIFPFRLLPQAPTNGWAKIASFGDYEGTGASYYSRDGCLYRKACSRGPGKLGWWAKLVQLDYRKPNRLS